MTPNEWASLAGGIGGPVSGIVIALIVWARSRRDTDATTAVAEKGVRVDERQAHTAEVAMIIDGFTESLAAVRSELKDARTELSDARDELKDAAAKYDGLRQEHDALKEQVDMERAAMITHIEALENLIPNPPGPPERPKWT
jgi:septal ring factor EnvC (AmiA/AmiB activator)